MASHGAGGRLRIAGKEGIDDRQVFVRLFREPVKIVAGGVMLPRHVAEDAEQHFEPADFLGQKRIAARLGHEIVQPADISVTLIHSGEKLLPMLSPKLADYTGTQLAKMGVKILFKFY